MNYLTISENANASFIEKRSEFIGYISPVKTNDEAVAFINSIKAEHRKAKHNVYAYILREDNISRYSDDGEPQGTAGQPLLELLTSNGFTDSLICVTRYFGGTLLGKGGLKRAYTDSGRMALSDGEPVELIPALKWREHCSYPFFEMLSRKSGQSGWILDNIEYGQDVVFDLTVPEEAGPEVIRSCLDMSGGTLVLAEPESLLMRGGKVSLS